MHGAHFDALLQIPTDHIILYSNQNYQNISHSKSRWASMEPKSMKCWVKTLTQTQRTSPWIYLLNTQPIIVVIINWKTKKSDDSGTAVAIATKKRAFHWDKRTNFMKMCNFKIDLLHWQTRLSPQASKPVNNVRFRCQQCIERFRWFPIIVIAQ